MKTVKLPKGVKVYAAGKCWKNAIPTDICPKKYQKGTASSGKGSKEA